MKRILIIILMTVSLMPLLKAQDCVDYHQYHCVYTDYTFFYSRQSKSTLFHRGQTSTFSIVAYGGEDYYVSVCAHRKFGDLHFRILDEKTSAVIYDNATNEYASSIVFSNENTRNMIIEVTVPPGSGSERDKRCVGVLIQFKEEEN